MFGEPALGDLAAATEHVLTSGGSGSAANATPRSAVQALVEAIDEPRPGAAQLEPKRRRA